MGYVQGTVVRCTGTFRDLFDLDEDGKPKLADPSQVTVRVRDPAGTITEMALAAAQVVRDSPGVFHVDVDTAPAAGPWIYQFDAGGDYDVTGAGRFTVDARI